ncbi:glutamate carboxypeptidase [Methylobacterium phyllostachyos]|uniref:Glutamate carboxypeptidase n=1 Tax=Methylobacterium phyllostachyos TaxID=582672 RepID=A0A1H0IIE7_9HYPH|nr:M20 family metallopeptidase [Methylobacterium phyllostachyos]SDO31060.1 glutamate carboxypeptidase [Methylobacterium phyllostachyos]
MTTHDTDALRWLDGQEGAMLALLEELVNIDSGSYDKPGVDAVGTRIAAFLAGEGIPVTTIPVEGYGDALKAEVAGSGGGNRPVVLMGHRDTVFPKGEVARRPFHIADGRAYGPGVADMKAGLVMNAFVLAAYHRAGGAPVPLVGLFTGDEEIGSPACRPIIEETARGARAVLNSEPGRPTGNVVTGRKGGVFMRLEVLGKAAHSGGNYADGRSAILELAHKTVAFHAITDLARGITVNVGLVSGGQSVNTVAPLATCEIDLRYVTPSDRAEAMDRITAIVSASTVSDTTAHLSIKGEFLPLVQDEGARALFETYAQVSAGLGRPVEGEFAGGCADSGFTASVGCPTLCAVGPVGGKAHSPEEYLEVGSLVPRARAMAQTIAAL